MDCDAEPAPGQQQKRCVGDEKDGDVEDEDEDEDDEYCLFAVVQSTSGAKPQDIARQLEELGFDVPMLDKGPEFAGENIQAQSAGEA